MRLGRGFRWRIVLCEGIAGEGLQGFVPGLPGDASVVGLVVHSNHFPLATFDESGRAFLEVVEEPGAEQSLNRVRGTDRAFLDSPPPGLGCLCSRCGEPISGVLPIRLLRPRQFYKGQELVKRDYEYRFHPACLGLANAPRVEEE